jgi:hypothetical protein
LKDHLLARYNNIPYDGDEHAFSDADRQSMVFLRDRIYSHNVLRINYTTYDMCRAQDSINIRAHPFVMVLAHEDDTDVDPHPYWYAKVLGIYHVNVRISDQAESQRMEFLWVHWFGRDPDHQAGFESRRPFRIGLMDREDPTSYGFIDPSDVLRAVHLIPAFANGTISRAAMDADDEEWEFYYVSLYWYPSSTALCVLIIA